MKGKKRNILTWILFIGATLLGFLITNDCEGQSLSSPYMNVDKLYKDYCTEGVRMDVDSVRQEGYITVEINFNDEGQLVHGKRDTTWYTPEFEIRNGIYYRTDEYARFSCTGNLRFTSSGNLMIGTSTSGFVDNPIRNEVYRHQSTTYSKPKTTITFHLSRMVYNKYYKEVQEKLSFEDWLKSNNYLK